MPILPDAREMVVWVSSFLIILLLVHHQRRSSKSKNMALTQRLEVCSILEHISWSLSDDPSEATNDNENDAPVDLSEPLPLGSIELCVGDQMGEDEEIIPVEVETVGDILKAIHDFYAAAEKVFEDFEKFTETHQKKIDGAGVFNHFYKKHTEHFENYLFKWCLGDCRFEGVYYIGDNKWRVSVGT